MKPVQNTQNIPKQKSFRIKVINFFQLSWTPKASDFCGNLFDMIIPHYCLICYFPQRRTLLALKSTALYAFIHLTILFWEFSENSVTLLKYLNTVRPCKLQPGDLSSPRSFWSTGKSSNSTGFKIGLNFSLFVKN